MSKLTDFDRQELTIEQQKALIDLDHAEQVAQMYTADAEARAAAAEAVDGVDVIAARAALAEELLRADVARTRRRTRAFEAYVKRVLNEDDDETQRSRKSGKAKPNSDDNEGGDKDNDDNNDAQPNSGGSFSSSYEGGDDDEEELLDGTYGL